MIIRLRLALLLAGVIAFTMALRTGAEWMRWAGIAFVGAALLLRFIKR
jgi:hypothetical protein